jgi:hypothetical protein
MSENLYYRIALTQAALETGANFFVRGLPRPELPTFADHAERVPKSQGGEARQGYSSVSLLWLRLDGGQAGVLRGLIEAAEAGAGLLYLTAPRVDAKHSGASWVDLSGIPLMPQWESLQGGLWVYENVVLRLNAVVILATPSTAQT